MQTIMTWIKTFLILYFFLTMILYLVPKDAYQKYIRFAVKMILLVVLFLPLLNKLSSEEYFFQLVEKLEGFQQEKNETLEIERLEKLQSAYVEERSGYYEEHFGESE
ncbi:MAG: stage III sporulation protein AF [Lachnospiraceae bacterium]|nr:stage III sporulation protein AF [Lachnospiraceae bacterium]MDD6183974.1 stage III sporulation protein AF [Lachnospiraceae bacterium]MDD7377955.1 stage III sporulation protein AF [Lachnospiraceae bacterium]MDY4616921.1 stage III sporulation protein AF [Lachnospiraceae bacterium]MDY5776208.1 stage III sporulation protein AF [Lachnospiraceae bacterium]